MITKVYTGRIGRYYPETRYFEQGTGVRAVAAVPFESYDFADEADVPADGDWADPGCYIPDPPAEPEPPEDLIGERQAWKDALAADAASADEARLVAEQLAPAAPAAPAASVPKAAAAVSSPQAGAPAAAPSAPSAPAQEG